MNKNSEFARTKLGTGVPPIPQNPDSITTTHGTGFTKESHPAEETKKPTEATPADMAKVEELKRNRVDVLIHRTDGRIQTGKVMGVLFGGKQVIVGWHDETAGKEMTKPVMTTEFLEWQDEKGE